MNQAAGSRLADLPAPGAGHSRPLAAHPPVRLPVRAVDLPFGVVSGSHLPAASRLGCGSNEKQSGLSPHRPLPLLTKRLPATAAPSFCVHRLPVLFPTPVE